MSTILVIIALLFVAFVLLRMTEQHRCKERLSRFATREAMEVKELVSSSFPGNLDIVEPLTFWWNRSASVLRIDPRLLRKDDRFDGILGPVKGHPVEDEVSELGDLVEQIVPESKKLHSSPLNTFGECVLYLAKHAGIQNNN